MSGPIEPLPAGFPPGVDGLFTTRAGGVSAGAWATLNLGLRVGDEARRVLANRELLARYLGTGPLTFPQQVHGGSVLVLDRSGTGGGGAADALVTDLPGVAIAVLVADCAPVLLADAAAGIVAAAHAGRRGLVAGVLEHTVAAMVDLGARPERMTAVVGPAIGGCCYEVPSELQAEVSAVVPDTATTTRAGTPALDLPRGAVALLRAAGVGTVHRVDVCTADDDRFYSYRRKPVTGRFAGAVVRR